METIVVPVAGTISEALALMRQMHERDTMQHWRALAGVDVQSWRIGNDALVFGADCGPNVARITARGDMFGARHLIVDHESDAEGLAVAATVMALSRSMRG